MGEVAEAMLDGTLCSSCGDFIGLSDGYPQMCAACGGDADVFIPPAPRTYRCHDCGRPFKRDIDLGKHRSATGHGKKAKRVKRKKAMPKPVVRLVAKDRDFDVNDYGDPP